MTTHGRFSPDGRWCAGLFLTALLLRAAHLLTILDAPFFLHLGLDPLAYDEWGRRIAAGDWLGTRVFYQDPLYPYFLGAVYAIVGHSHAAAVALQLLLGSLVAPLVYDATRRGLGRAEAAVAGVLAALYGPAIHYDGLILKTWMEPFFMAAVLWALARRDGERRWPAWAGGFLLGLGSLARANFLLLLPATAAWIGLEEPRRGSGTASDRPRARGRWRAAAAFCVGAAVVLGATAVRNRIAGGEWVLTTAQGGQNFYIGNNPLNRTGEYDPLPFVGANPKHEERGFAEEAARRTGRVLSAKEISRFWFAEGLDWIRSHPGDWARLTFRKLRVFWGAYEVPDNLDYYVALKSAPVLRLPLPGFGLVAPLGLVGAVLVVRRKGWARLLLVCLVVYAASVVLFYVFARYRMAMMPLLFPLAGHAAVETARRVRSFVTARGRAAAEPGTPRTERALPALRAVGGIVVALAFVNLPARAPADYWTYRLARALGLPAREANTATAHFNLGVLYAKEAKDAASPESYLRRAEVELREALRQETRYAKVHVELGKVLARLGRDREAIEQYERALQIEPGHWRALHSLGLLRRRVGDAEGAAEAFRRAMTIEPRQADSPLELGWLLLELGRHAEAAEAFRRALDAAPDSEPARRGLAAAVESP